MLYMFTYNVFQEWHQTLCRCTTSVDNASLVLGNFWTNLDQSKFLESQNVFLKSNILIEESRCLQDSIFKAKEHPI